MSRLDLVLKFADLLKQGHITQEMFTDVVNHLYKKEEVKRVGFKDYSYVKIYDPSFSIKENKSANVLRIKT